MKLSLITQMNEVNFPTLYAYVKHLIVLNALNEKGKINVASKMHYTFRPKILDVLDSTREK